jgi:hypothetical protein
VVKEPWVPPEQPKCLIEHNPMLGSRDQAGAQCRPKIRAIRKTRSRHGLHGRHRAISPHRKPAGTQRPGEMHDILGKPPGGFCRRSLRCQ